MVSLSMKWGRIKEDFHVYVSEFKHKTISKVLKEGGDLEISTFGIEKDGERDRDRKRGERR